MFKPLTEADLAAEGHLIWRDPDGYYQVRAANLAEAKWQWYYSDQRDGLWVPCGIPDEPWLLQAFAQDLYQTLRTVTFRLLDLQPSPVGAPVAVVTPVGDVREVARHAA